ncbi:MAG: thiamine pyrophosphate-binding protein [Planctomycetia bacterium]|nr:thiamine pyrophosphate-binding protein [Planctomycetia bacterium]
MHDELTNNMTSLTGADVLLKCLRAQGVRAVFGMPGTQNVGLYDAFHRSGDGIAHYLIRHEQGATMLANGFARASGDVGIAFTVPGPGAANAATGILDALTDCIPVLLVVGGYDRPFAKRDRTKMFHGLDQAAFFKPLARYFGRPATVDDIPRIVTEAFEAMFAGRPGPAVIELPPDLAIEPVGREISPPPAVPKLVERPVKRTEIISPASAIRRMRRPVVLVGADCVIANASDEVRRLAERLQAPVVYGRRGKGVIPDDHPLVAGFTRSKRAVRLLESADGVIAIGVRFTQIDMLNWTIRLPENLVQFDRDPRELGREYPISTGFAGSLAPALRAVCDELEWLLPDVDAEWSHMAHAEHEAWNAEPAIPILSQIRRALPADGIVSVDITAAGYNCFDRFPVPGPRSMIYPCHSVSLGFAFPAAIGAKIAAPERPVVSLSGDGGFVMGCFELGTAVEHRVGVVAVVVKDHCLSAIKGSQVQAFQGRSIDVQMQSPDFVTLAHSFGAYGISTGDIEALPRLIEEGLQRPGPTVIEVRMHDRVDEMISVIPWLHGE